jgi:hypothetical protein
MPYFVRVRVHGIYARFACSILCYEWFRCRQPVEENSAILGPSAQQAHVGRFVNITLRGVVKFAIVSVISRVPLQHTCQQVSWLTQLCSALSAQSIPLSRAQLVSLQAKLSGRLKLTHSAHSAQLIGAVGFLRRMVLVEERSHDIFLVLSFLFFALFSSPPSHVFQLCYFCRFRDT